MLARSSRTFSTSARSLAGFSDWFRFMSPTQRMKTKELKEKMSDIEEKDKQADKELDGKSDKKIDYTKLEVIGLPKQRTREEVQAALGSFKVDLWLNSFKKITSVKQLDSVLIESWNEVFAEKVSGIDELQSKPLNDLAKRFEFFKKVQSKSGYYLSDLLLTQAHTVSVIRTHFTTKVLTKEALNFNDRQPNAIYVDESTFAHLPNVVVDHKVTLKERRQKLAKLNAEVEKYKQERLEKA